MLMRNLVIFAAILLLASSVFPVAYYGTQYPGTTGSTGGKPSGTPPLVMKISVSENCSGIFVTVLSSEYMAASPYLENASVEVDALPRTAVVVLASGQTDSNGMFSFNTSADNLSITATKDGFSPARAEFAPQHPVCLPNLTLSISPDCALGGAWLTVLADSKPAERALVSVDGVKAGYTDADGNISVPLLGAANISVSFGGAVLNQSYTPPVCPKNQTSPPQQHPPVQPQNASPAPTPQQPGAPLNIPLIAGIVIVVLLVMFALSKLGGKGGSRMIGPGPIPPAKEIGPGPMKKSQIGPGPMKKEIGPGPMKKEIGPGPM